MSSALNPRVRRWLTGCAISLGAAVLLLVVFALAGYWWAATPGLQVDSEWFIGPETVGIFHLDRPFDDKGVLDFVTSLMGEMQKRQMDMVREESPALRRLARIFGPNPRRIRSDLQRDAPRQVTLVLEAIAGSDRPQPAAILNLNRFPRVLSFGTQLYAWLAEDDARYRGFNLIPFEGGELTFVESTFLWSRSGQGLRQVLDRLDQVPRGPEAQHYPQGEGFADPRWDLFGSVENRAGAIAYLLDLWKAAFETSLQVPEQIPLEAFQSMESLALGLDLKPDDQALVYFNLLLRSESEQQAWKSSLESLLSEVSSQQDSFLESYRLSGQGPRLELEMEVSGLRDLLVSYVLRSIPVEGPPEEPPGQEAPRVPEQFR